MYLDTNGLYFSGMEIKVAERIVKLDNARIFILVTGLIIIVGFSIFTFMGPSPSSPKSGTVANGGLGTLAHRFSVNIGYCLIVIILHDW
jgi:hypothetical protein